MAKKAAPDGAPWTFLTNHAQVLLVIATDPDARVRDIAAACAITERRAYGILADLESAGYIDRKRDGRRVRITLRKGARMRAPIVRDVPVRELLRLLDARG